MGKAARNKKQRANQNHGVKSGFVSPDKEKILANPDILNKYGNVPLPEIWDFTGCDANADIQHIRRAGWDFPDDAVIVSYSFDPNRYVVRVEYQTNNGDIGFITRQAPDLLGMFMLLLIAFYADVHSNLHTLPLIRFFTNIESTNDLPASSPSCGVVDLRDTCLFVIEAVSLGLRGDEDFLPPLLNDFQRLIRDLHRI